MILFKVGSRNAQFPKMVGAFLIIVSILMLVHSGAVMFDSWQAVKHFDNCVDDAYAMQGTNPELVSILSELKYQDCKDSLQDITGAQVAGGTKVLTSRQFWTAFLGPVSIFFIWAIVFLFALFIFNNTSVIVPVEKVEIDLEKRTAKKKSSKTKKKKR
jgi:hypothetical protein